MQKSLPNVSGSSPSQQDELNIDKNQENINAEKAELKNNDSGLTNFLKELDKEGQQESQLKSRIPDESSIANQDAEKVREREREYKDVEKHWVRREIWLKIAQDLERQTRKTYNRGLRYMTLPAYYRIDVELLHRENLIEVVSRNNDGEADELYVVGFEAEATKFGRMAVLNPKLKLFGHSPLEKALIDKTNDYYHQVRTLFPFEIINFDLTTSLTPKREGPFSDTLIAIDTIFDL